jgi:hypothetical protein
VDYNSSQLKTIQLKSFLWSGFEESASAGIYSSVFKLIISFLSVLHPDGACIFTRKSVWSQVAEFPVPFGRL